MNIIVGALITTLSLSPMPVSKETADTASLIVFEQTEEEKHAEEMILAEKEKAKTFFISFLLPKQNTAPPKITKTETITCSWQVRQLMKP